MSLNGEELHSSRRYNCGSYAYCWYLRFLLVKKNHLTVHFQIYFYNLVVAYFTIFELHLFQAGGTTTQTHRSSGPSTGSSGNAT